MKTLVIITGVILAAAIVYLTMPEGPPVAGMRLAEMPEEGNGVIGRFIGELSEVIWHPQQFAIGTLLISLIAAGLYFYWKSTED